MDWCNATCVDGVEAGRVLSFTTTRTNGAAFGGHYMGSVSGLAFQPAPDFYCPAVRRVVCVDRGGDRQHL